MAETIETETRVTKKKTRQRNATACKEKSNNEMDGSEWQSVQPIYMAAWTQVPHRPLCTNVNFCTRLKGWQMRSVTCRDAVLWAAAAADDNLSVSFCPQTARPSSSLLRPWRPTEWRHIMRQRDRSITAAQIIHSSHPRHAYLHAKWFSPLRTLQPMTFARPYNKTVVGRQLNGLYTYTKNRRTWNRYPLVP